MNLNKFLTKGLIVIGVLILGLIFFLTLNFNKTFDFTGGTIVSINTQNYTFEQAEKKVADVLNENDICSYTITRGTQTSNDDKVIIVKFAVNKDVEIVNQKIETELFAEFEYDSNNQNESRFIQLTSNVDSAVNYSTFLYAFLGIIALGVASSIYISARHGLSVGFSLFAQLVLDIGLTLALVLITRIAINAYVGVAIMGTACVSLVFSFVTLNALVNAAKQEKFAKVPNKEIAETVLKSQQKTLLIFAGVIIAFALILGLFIFKTFICPILILCLAVVSALFTSQTITPVLWANSYKYKKKMKKIGVDPKVNPDNAHI